MYWSDDISFLNSDQERLQQQGEAPNDVPRRERSLNRHENYQVARKSHPAVNPRRRTVFMELEEVAIHPMRKSRTAGVVRGQLTGGDESTLVRRAQQGDPVPFERLYRQHVGRVYGLCLRLTGKAPDAEEMTQEVFVRAWQHLDSFKGQSHFTAWLHRVAVNLARNEWRTRARRGVPREWDDEAPGPDASESGPEPGVRMDLEQAIKTLPPGARQVFVLHDVHGYRHHEISEMTGLAVGTTKAQLHRARKRLRLLMAGRGPQPRSQR